VSALADSVAPMPKTAASAIIVFLLMVFLSSLICYSGCFSSAVEQNWKRI